MNSPHFASVLRTSTNLNESDSQPYSQMYCSVIAVEASSNSSVPFLLAAFDYPLHVIELGQEHVEVCWLTLNHKETDGVNYYCENSLGVISANSIITEAKFTKLDGFFCITPQEINRLLQMTLLRSSNSEMALSVTPDKILSRFEEHGQIRYLVLYKGSTTWIPNKNVSPSLIESFENQNSEKDKLEIDTTHLAPKNINLKRERKSKLVLTDYKNSIETNRNHDHVNASCSQENFEIVKSEPFPSSVPSIQIVQENEIFLNESSITNDDGFEFDASIFPFPVTNALNVSFPNDPSVFNGSFEDDERNDSDSLSPSEDDRFHAQYDPTALNALNDNAQHLSNTHSIPEPQTALNFYDNPQMDKAPNRRIDMQMLRKRRRGPKQKHSSLAPSKIKSRSRSQPKIDDVSSRKKYYLSLRDIEAEADLELKEKYLRERERVLMIRKEQRIAKKMHEKGSDGMAKSTTAYDRAKSVPNLIDDSHYACSPLRNNGISSPISETKASLLNTNFQPNLNSPNSERNGLDQAHPIIGTSPNVPNENEMLTKNDVDVLPQKLINQSNSNSLNLSMLSPALISHNRSETNVQNLQTAFIIPPRVEQRTPQFITHIYDCLLEGEPITNDMTFSQVYGAIQKALTRLRFVFHKNTTRVHGFIRSVLSAHANANGEIPPHITTQAALFEQFDRKQQESDYEAIVARFKHVLMLHHEKSSEMMNAPQHTISSVAFSPSAMQFAPSSSVSQMSVPIPPQAQQNSYPQFDAQKIQQTISAFNGLNVQQQQLLISRFQNNLNLSDTAPNAINQNHQFPQTNATTTTTEIQMRGSVQHISEVNPSNKPSTPIAASKTRRRQPGRNRTYSPGQFPKPPANSYTHHHSFSQSQPQIQQIQQIQQMRQIQQIQQTHQISPQQQMQQVSSPQQQMQQISPQQQMQHISPPQQIQQISSPQQPQLQSQLQSLPQPQLQSLPQPLVNNRSAGQMHQNMAINQMGNYPSYQQALTQFHANNYQNIPMTYSELNNSETTQFSDDQQTYTDDYFQNISTVGDLSRNSDYSMYNTQNVAGFSSPQSNNNTDGQESFI